MVGAIIFLTVIIILVVKYVKQQKREIREDQIAAELEDSKAMEDAMKMLTDFSHLSVYGICLLYVATGEAECHINTELLLIDDGSFSKLQFLLDHFKRYQADIIGKSVAGQITREEMSSKVQSEENTVNQLLAAELLNKQQPMSYPFMHLREFLKPVEDDNMEIKYPIVLESEMRDYRPIFLRVLREKITIVFSNCTVHSSNATSLTLYFSSVT